MWTLIITMIVLEGDAQPTIDHVNYETRSLCEDAATVVKNDVKRTIERTPTTYAKPTVFIAATCTEAREVH